MNAPPPGPWDRARRARAEELSVEMLAPSESQGMDADGRPWIRAPFARIGVRELPTVHPMLVIGAEIWGPPNTRAEVTVHFDRPEDRAIDPFGHGPGAPVQFEFDAAGIVGFGATLAGLPLTSEGIHAVTVMCDGKVLAKRRLRVVVVPANQFPTDGIPNSL